jgi:hypothetical protein
MLQAGQGRAESRAAGGFLSAVGVDMMDPVQIQFATDEVCLLFCPPSPLRQATEAHVAFATRVRQLLQKHGVEAAQHEGSAVQDQLMGGSATSDEWLLGQIARALQSLPSDSAARNASDDRGGESLALPVVALGRDAGEANI